MKIKTILSQYRNDFTATIICEHCNHEEKLTTGYDDNYYHTTVLPARTCSKCYKNRAGDIPRLTLETSYEKQIVLYIPRHAVDDMSKWEQGVISSKNDTYVFVRFNGNPGVAVDPSDLTIKQ